MGRLKRYVEEWNVEVKVGGWREKFEEGMVEEVRGRKRNWLGV